jgi:hypothetical protein
LAFSSAWWASKAAESSFAQCWYVHGLTHPRRVDRSRQESTRARREEDADRPEDNLGFAGMSGMGISRRNALHAAPLHFPLLRVSTKRTKDTHETNRLTGTRIHKQAMPRFTTTATAPHRNRLPPEATRRRGRWAITISNRLRCPHTFIVHLYFSLSRTQTGSWGSR